MGDVKSHTFSRNQRSGFQKSKINYNQCNREFEKFFHNEVTLDTSKKENNDKIVSQVVHDLLSQNKDSRIGEPVCVGSSFQRLKTGAPDEYDFNIPLEGFQRRSKDMFLNNEKNEHSGITNSLSYPVAQNIWKLAETVWSLMLALLSRQWITYSMFSLFLFALNQIVQMCLNGSSAEVTKSMPLICLSICSLVYFFLKMMHLILQYFAGIFIGNRPWYEAYRSQSSCGFLQFQLVVRYLAEHPTIETYFLYIHFFLYFFCITNFAITLLILLVIAAYYLKKYIWNWLGFGRPNSKLQSRKPRLEKGDVNFTLTEREVRLKRWTDWTEGKNLMPYLVKNHIRRKIEANVAVLNKKSNYIRCNIQLDFEEGGSGTAVSCILQHPKLTCPVSLDFSPVLANIGPLPYPGRWDRSKSCWPPQQTVFRIKKLGVSLVPRNGRQWKVSSCFLEEELMNDMHDDPTTNGCRRKCHRILKKINEKYFCDPSKPVVCSYVLKNILFFECQYNSYGTNWQNDRLAKRIISMTEKLAEGIEDEFVGNYACPDLNVFHVKDRTALENAKKNIQIFLNNPEKFMQQINKPINGLTFMNIC